jgi:solute carrier family 25 carnitine/acylcarnitine transporter 20/29
MSSTVASVTSGAPDGVEGERKQAVLAASGLASAQAGGQALAWLSSASRAAAPLAINATAGLVGGVCCVLVGHPLDTAKVLMQAQSSTARHFGSNTTVGCLAQVLRSRGLVRGWYAGGSAALAANAAENTLLFMSYSQIKAAVEQGFSKAPLRDMVAVQQHKTFLAGAAAGGIGSLVTSLALCPIELVKVRVQTGGETGLARCALNIARQGGLRALYKGLGATVLREAPGNVAFFGTYEAALGSLRRNGVFATDDARVLVAGGLAGIGFWLVALPADNVKTQQQLFANSGGLLSAANEIRASQGMRGFYRGLVPVLVRAFPSNAALFWGVSKTQSFFDGCY